MIFLGKRFFSGRTKVCLPRTQKSWCGPRKISIFTEWPILLSVGRVPTLRKAVRFGFHLAQPVTYKEIIETSLVQSPCLLNSMGASKLKAVVDRPRVHWDSTPGQAWCWSVRRLGVLARVVRIDIGENLAVGSGATTQSCKVDKHVKEPTEKQGVGVACPAVALAK